MPQTESEQIEPGRIVCESCGRSGPYRPEFAGKQIKCKCGHIMLAIEPPDLVQPRDEPSTEQPGNEIPADEAHADEPAPGEARRSPARSPRADFTERDQPRKKSGAVKWTVLLLLLALAAGGVFGWKYISKYVMPATNPSGTPSTTDPSAPVADKTS
jgi:hypothetical protein